MKETKGAWERERGQPAKQHEGEAFTSRHRGGDEQKVREKSGEGRRRSKRGGVKRNLDVRMALLAVRN